MCLLVSLLRRDRVVFLIVRQQCVVIAACSCRDLPSIRDLVILLQRGGGDLTSARTLTSAWKLTLVIFWVLLSFVL